MSHIFGEVPQEQEPEFTVLKKERDAWRGTRVSATLKTISCREMGTMTTIGIQSTNVCVCTYLTCHICGEVPQEHELEVHRLEEGTRRLERYARLC